MRSGRRSGRSRRRDARRCGRSFRAQILLQADADGLARTDEQIAAALGCHPRTVGKVQRRFVSGRLEAALHRKPQDRLSRERALDGAGEARLIALACNEPPEGRVRWTLQLLADELVRLEVVPAISGQTVRRTLKITTCSPIGSSAG